MKTVLVTGSSGFIGKNLIELLKTKPDIKILIFHHHESIKKLKKYLSQSDFVFHLAGVNRPQDNQDYQTGNVDFTKTLTDNLLTLPKKIPILMSSSIQAEMDNPYGKSKKSAEKLLLQYSSKSKAPVFIFRLPNVFGKWSQPNYNTVVATFCYNLSHNIDINITDTNKIIKFVYIDDVLNEFIKILDTPTTHKNPYYNIDTTFDISLGNLASKIHQIKDIRTHSTIPDLSDLFTKYLYSTYLSFVDKNNLSYALDLKKDNRGELFELIKSHQFGQIFVSKTNKGITRGNHFHHTKIEKFCVISGKATVKLRHILNNEVISYNVSGKDIRIIDIPPGYTHSITNTSKQKLITLFWANEIFDPQKPDTYYQDV